MSIHAHKQSRFLIVFLLFIISSHRIHGVTGSRETYFEGYVSDVNGDPVRGAVISIFDGNVRHQNVTDSKGFYRILAKRHYKNSILIATWKENGTGVYGTVPQGILISETESPLFHNFTLAPCSFIFFNGPFQIVEADFTVYDYFFKFQKTGQYSKDLNLTYGRFEDLSKMLDLDPRLVIVPCNIQVEVRNEVLFRKHHGFEETVVEEIGRVYEITVNTPGRGLVHNVTVTNYTLTHEFTHATALQEKVQSQISEWENYGFYTTQEKQKLHSVREKIHTAQYDFHENLLDTAFIELCDGYLELRDIENSLDTMRRDAIFSFNILIMLSAFTSLVIPTVITRDDRSKLQITYISYLAMTGYVALIYPGSRIVGLAYTLGLGIFSIFFMKGLLHYLPSIVPEPRVQTTRLIDTFRATLRIAQRNLVRRKLRTFLTVSNLLVLTMGFIALTSLTTGYGLVSAEIDSTTSINGILVKMPEYSSGRNFWYKSSVLDFYFSNYDAGYFYEVRPFQTDWVVNFDNVASAVVRMCSIPNDEGYFFGGPSGIVCFDPERDPIIPQIYQHLVGGKPALEDGTCLVHENVLQKNGLSLNDSITINIRIPTPYGFLSRELTNSFSREKACSLKIVGVFGDSIAEIKDVDGNSILPIRQTSTGDNSGIFYTAIPCTPEETLITTLNSGKNIPDVRPENIYVQIENNTNIMYLGKSMALSSEFRFWLSDSQGIFSVQMGSTMEGKGLQILVPWLIAVFTVVISMLSSLYDRQSEINVLSSVGLNPGHISTIFLFEGVIMGTLAGGLGYLLGLGWYPVMVRLAFSPLVKMKVSIIWSLAALTVSLASVIFGTLIALRRSLSLTPSFRRRWRLLTKKSEIMDNWTIPLPLVLTESEIPGFLEFARYSLKRHLRTSYEGEPAVMIREPGIEEDVSWSIVFWYTAVRGLDVTRNSVHIIKNSESTYTTRLHTYGHRKGAEKAAIITRKVIIEWNTQKTALHTRSHDN